MPFKKGELPLSAVAKRQLTQRIKEFKGLSRICRARGLRWTSTKTECCRYPTMCGFVSKQRGSESRRSAIRRFRPDTLETVNFNGGFVHGLVSLPI